MNSIFDLPDVEFAAKDAGDIQASILTTYEAISGRSLAEGDPIRLFLSAIGLLIIQQRALIDQASKMNTLRYAVGDYLDHIGALFGTLRLAATAARTTLRFTVSEVQGSAITIPAGTRATPDGRLYFETEAVCEIPAGQEYIDISAVCTDVGSVGNGFLSGQINKMVDLIPFIGEVTNTAESSGGTDAETDDAFRQRIFQAPESYSVAGPSGAYIYWAKSASSLIADVSVSSPAAGQVEIRPLLINGGIPGQTILDLVAAACNNRSVRPLTDQVTVVAPEAVSYNITLTYYIRLDRATQATAIQVAVTQAIADYVLWQKSTLGQDINPSELIMRVMAAGAKRVVVTSPVHTAVSISQVAVCGTVTATYGGLEGA